MTKPKLKPKKRKAKPKEIFVKDGAKLSAMSTDELFEETASRGLQFGNLCELDDRRWICNLHTTPIKHGNGNIEIKYFEFGRAPTYRQAIMVALHNAHYLMNTSNQTYQRHVIRDWTQ